MTLHGRVWCYLDGQSGLCSEDSFMAKKPKRPAKPIQPGEVTLYDSMLEMVGKMQTPRRGNASPESSVCSAGWLGSRFNQH